MSAPRPSRSRSGFPADPSPGDTFVVPDTGLAYRYSGRQARWYRAPALDVPLGAEPLTSAVRPDQVPPSRPQEIVLYDQRPHPLLPPGQLASFQLVDLSPESAAKLADLLTERLLGLLLERAVLQDRVSFLTQQLQNQKGI